MHFKFIIHLGYLHILYKIQGYSDISDIRPLLPQPGLEHTTSGTHSPSSDQPAPLALTTQPSWEDKNLVLDDKRNLKN